MVPGGTINELQILATGCAITALARCENPQRVFEKITTQCLLTSFSTAERADIVLLCFRHAHESASC